MKLEDFLSTIAGVPPAQKAEIVASAVQATKDMCWVPNPGPQTDAFFSPADELFYGGQAGGGKTDLEIGLALTAHRRSMILRRTNKEVLGLVERMSGILGSRDGFNSQSGMWRRPDDRVIDLGGVQLEEDKQKYKGIPHDLICFDEVSDFTESQYTFILAWNRSAIPGQRCRVVAAGNPPTRPEGLWVLRRWAAWLDPQHHNPAQPGELRWYTSDTDGKEVEVDGRGPHELDGQQVYARSRTFIPATLQDNPDLMATDYQASLDSLSGAERSAYRDGNFGAALQDDAMQAIPTSWIREAQARWTVNPPVGVPMCAMGVDIAQGGKDHMVIAMRHDGWYAPLVKIPGKLVPDGITASGLVVAKRRDSAMVILDVGGGWGADTVMHLKDNGIECVPYMGVKQSTRRAVGRQLSFFNIRTEAYWRFREALDPSQPQGSTIALPLSPTMVADLCAPTYQVIGSTVGGKVKIESKEDVCHRLGRSTDEGDAVVMAWFDGVRGMNIKGGWQNFGANRNPQVIMKNHRT
jgi:hypothetical protein